MKKLCIGKNLRKLWSCDSGAVAPLVGVCAIMLVGAVAVAVDVGRGQVAQSKLQAALDSAGLAAGAVVSQTLDDETLKDEGWKYLQENFAGQTIDATITYEDFDVELSDDDRLVTLTARASLPTTFMKIFGHDTMNVAARTEITREMTGLEIVLVLDVTGSMCQPNCAKRDAMRTGAKNLVEKMLGDASENNVDDLFIGIVPFSQAVNIGTTRTGWLSDWATRSAQDNCVGWNHANWSHTHSAGENPRYCPTNGPNVSTRTWPLTLVDDWMFSSNAGWYFQHAWGGCVEARHVDGEDVTDTPPSEAGFPAYFAPDTSSSGGNDWRSSSGAYQVNSSRSANKGCPPAVVVPMTNDKATLDTAIDNLNVAGYTMLPVGASWGWRMLSPKWEGLWGGDMDANNLPLPYDEPLMDKVIVFMTDGDNDMPPAGDPTYLAYGRLSDGYLGTTNETAAQAELDSRFAQICQAMEDEGIKIYTISLGAGVAADSRELLKDCASLEPYYFHAADGTELIQKFNEVADALSKLRVSK
jgi:Flp pilus assembly protein TadG